MSECVGDEPAVASAEEMDQSAYTNPAEKLDETRLRYENGKCYYADPNTGSELEWSEEKQAWIPQVDLDDKTRDYVLENGVYCYTDKTTGVKYWWDNEQNKWETGVRTIRKDIAVKEDVEEEEEDADPEDETEEKKVTKKKVLKQDMSKGVYGFEGDTHTYTDPNDGTVYLWDREKNAWFPKIDDDFLAHYQMNYGVSGDKPEEEKVEPEPPKPVKEKPEDSKEAALKRKLEPPTWFDVDDTNNTKVYVSNLPTDITETEFVDLMQKCGLVMKDVDTGKMKIKLYTEAGSEQLKGDALCTYIKVESVELALNLLDGYDVRGKKIKVERAKFTMKGEAYDPTLKPKKKRRKDKEKLKKIQAKLFDWRPEKLKGQRAKNEKVVIVKNLFEPSVFDQDVGLILEYQQDLREECLKCGDVRRVIIYDRHPEGVAQINFKEPEAADACIQLLNGRWFGKRQITAETWDGKTKFKIAETDAQINERIDKWDSFLEGEAKDKNGDKPEDESKEKDTTVKETFEDTGSAKVALDSDNETRSSAGSGDETE